MPPPVFYWVGIIMWIIVVMAYFVGVITKRFLGKTNNPKTIANYDRGLPIMNKGIKQLRLMIIFLSILYFYLISLQHINSSLLINYCLLCTLLPGYFIEIYILRYMRITIGKEDETS